LKLFETATSLDIDGWLRGLFSAGISGGASAVVGGFTVSGMDPKDYNFATAKFYILIGALFTTNAVVSIAKFLSQQPLPGLKQVEKTVQTITPATNDSPKVIETVKEIHVEPMDKASHSSQEKP
jgi:hypothetical protein